MQIINLFLQFYLKQGGVRAERNKLAIAMFITTAIIYGLRVFFTILNKIIISLVHVFDLGPKIKRHRFENCVFGTFSL